MKNIIKKAWSEISEFFYLIGAGIELLVMTWKHPEEEELNG